VTFLHVYVLGFACTMGLCALTFWPYREHHEIRKNLVAYTIGSLIVSACWPFILIAFLVATTDQ
jgi:hypothetical protein